GSPILDGPNEGKPAPSGRGLRPVDAGSYSRDVVGGYAGVETQVTDAFSVDLTGRYEDYSDFGGTATGKLALRYEFDPSLAARATASTGYRAPSLGQIGLAASTRNPQTDGTMLETRTVPVNS